MCLCSFHLRKKGRKIFQKLKKRAGGLPNHKGDSAPAPESVALSELSSLTEKVAEEAGSRDSVETTKESTGSPPEPSVMGVGVLSSAATFCCGGQEVMNKPGGGDAEKSCTAGTSVKPGLLETSLISHIFHLRKSSLLFLSVCPPGPGTLSTSSPGGVMFVRLRVQPNKKAAGGLQLGTTKALPIRDAWLVLSQERCAVKQPEHFFFYRGRPRPDLCRLKYYFVFKIHQFPPSGTLEAAECLREDLLLVTPVTIFPTSLLW